MQMNDKFTKPADLRIAAERSFMLDERVVTPKVNCSDALEQPSIGCLLYTSDAADE